MYNELNDVDDVQCCRICLDEDCTTDNPFVAPCRCSGSVKYVHQNCLRCWCEKSKNDRMVIPGVFGQFNMRCEICHTPFSYIYNQTKPNHLIRALATYFVGITLSLALCYFLCGRLLMLIGKPNLIYTFDNQEATSYFNGFLLTHFILGLFYILMGFYVAMKDGNCYCFMCMGDCGGGGSTDDGGCIIVCVIVIGILGTFLAIYFDVLYRVVEREENRYRDIKLFKNHGIHLDNTDLTALDDDIANVV